MIPKIELDEAGDLEADGHEVTSENKETETEDADVKCDNNNTDMKIAEKETLAGKEIDEETAVAAVGAATAAATAAGVAAAASTNGNSGAAAAAKSTLKYNPIGE